jgi:hypothetical protein
MYHHNWAVVDIWLPIPSTTIIGQWTGDQFGLQGLFNMGGGHLPPYLGSGLVINLACKACSICGWWTSTTIFGQWTGDQFGLQGLSNMGAGHLPP